MKRVVRKYKNDRDRRAMRRKLSIRKKIEGRADCPRLCSIKTNKHIGIQIVDDVAQKSLYSIFTYSKEFGKKGGKNKEDAKLIGQKIADKLKSLKIEKAVFDRNGKMYTGLLALMVDAIRENGIKL